MPRYRLEYAKNGTARFLSHRELMTSLQRALRRASFPLSYSKGYNPRPKLSFGPPLGVGVAGLREYMDLELTEGINVEDYLNCLNCLLPAPYPILAHLPQQHRSFLLVARCLGEHYTVYHLFLQLQTLNLPPSPEFQGGITLSSLRPIPSVIYTTVTTEF
jgi:radical SAM-linked protein